MKPFNLTRSPRKYNKFSVVKLLLYLGKGCTHITLNIFWTSEFWKFTFCFSVCMLDIKVTVKCTAKYDSPVIDYLFAESGNCTAWCTGADNFRIFITNNICGIWKYIMCFIEYRTNLFTKATVNTFSFIDNRIFKSLIVCLHWYALFMAHRLTCCTSATMFFICFVYIYHFNLRLRNNWVHCQEMLWTAFCDF